MHKTSHRLYKLLISEIFSGIGFMLSTGNESRRAREGFFNSILRLELWQENFTEEVLVAGECAMLKIGTMECGMKVV